MKTPVSNQPVYQHEKKQEVQSGGYKRWNQCRNTVNDKVVKPCRFVGLLNVVPLQLFMHPVKAVGEHFVVQNKQDNKRPQGNVKLDSGSVVVNLKRPDGKRKQGTKDENRAFYSTLDFLPGSFVFGFLPRFFPRFTVGAFGFIVGVV